MGKYGIQKILNLMLITKWALILAPFRNRQKFWIFKNPYQQIININYLLLKNQIYSSKSNAFILYKKNIGLFNINNKECIVATTTF
jgi:hypothetical protein